MYSLSSLSVDRIFSLFWLCFSNTFECITFIDFKYLCSFRRVLQSLKLFSCNYLSKMIYLICLRQCCMHVQLNAVLIAIGKVLIMKCTASTRCQYDKMYCSNAISICTICRSFLPSSRIFHSNREPKSWKILKETFFIIIHFDSLYKQLYFDFIYHIGYHIW